MFVRLDERDLIKVQTLLVISPSRALLDVAFPRSSDSAVLGLPRAYSSGRSKAQRALVSSRGSDCGILILLIDPETSEHCFDVISGDTGDAKNCGLYDPGSLFPNIPPSSHPSLWHERIRATSAVGDPSKCYFISRTRSKSRARTIDTCESRCHSVAHNMPSEQTTPVFAIYPLQSHVDLVTVTN